MPESEIEDSQMSPHARPTAGSRLTKNMSTVEDMPSQEHSSYDFNARTALDPMELDDDAAATRDFIAEKRLSMSLHNSHLPIKPPVQKNAVDDAMEIPATASDPKASIDCQDTVVEPSQSAQSKKKKEKKSKSSNTETTKAGKDDETRPESSRTDISKDQAATDNNAATLERYTNKNKREKERRKRRKEEKRIEEAGQV